MKITVEEHCFRNRFVTSFRGRLVLFAAVVGVSNVCFSAILPREQEQTQEKTAEQQFKNIKVFQGLPSSQLIPAMSYMTASLGVQCTYCHVERGFDKDDKEEKESARKMISMVRDINKENFSGRDEVTCNTCHHGQPHPASMPALAEIGGKPAPLAQAAERKTREPLPSVDQVFEKYFLAVGGKGALEKIESRVMKGTRTTSEGWSGPIEIYQKAPAKMLATFKPSSAFNTGFDGTIGWFQSDHGIRELEGPSLTTLKREAKISRSLDLREEYRNLRVIGRQPVGNREAYVVQGITSGNHTPERLFFDVESGLLLKISSRVATPLGPLPEETDYDDYRDVEGIKLPFVISHLGADRSYKDVYSEISENVRIEDSRFEKPADSAK